MLLGDMAPALAILGIDPLAEGSSGATAASSFEEHPGTWRLEALDFLEPRHPAGTVARATAAQLPRVP